MVKLQSRSYFCVLNNVNRLFDVNDMEYLENKKEKQKKLIKKFRENIDEKYRNGITEKEIVGYLIGMWIKGKENRTCAINYEISDSGMHHCHMVLEDKAPVRSSTVARLFPTIHMEATRGSKIQAEAYIEKKGRFEEKKHTVKVKATYKGEIQGKQGHRSDLEEIEDLLKEGLTPEEVMSVNFKYRKYSKMIKEGYYAIRLKNANLFKNDMKVYYHYGKSGSGKSFQQIKLMEKHGRDSTYVVSDYENGGFDLYQGEKILFLDELKVINYGFLLKLLDKYVQQIHARYTNVHSLWEEVHISTIFNPYELYNNIIGTSDKNTDTIEQLLRRIDYMIYHYKIGNEYKSIKISMEKYRKYKNNNEKIKDTDLYRAIMNNKEI